MVQDIWAGIYRGKTTESKREGKRSGTRSEWKKNNKTV